MYPKIYFHETHEQPSKLQSIVTCKSVHQLDYRYIKRNSYVRKYNSTTTLLPSTLINAQNV